MYDLNTIVALNEKATNAGDREEAITALKIIARVPVQAFENDLKGAVNALALIQIVAGTALTKLGVEEDEAEDLGDANERAHAA